MDRLASRPAIEESHERDAEAGEKADLEAMLGDFGVGGGRGMRVRVSEERLRARKACARATHRICPSCRAS